MNKYDQFSIQGRMPYRVLAMLCGLIWVFATGWLHSQETVRAALPASPPLEPALQPPATVPVPVPSVVPPSAASKAPAPAFLPQPPEKTAAPVVPDIIALKSAETPASSAPAGTAASAPETGVTKAGPPSPEDMLPTEFLACVGIQTKARWRQLYREQPPTPSAQRLRVAFTLGSLQGDAYLALQAGDSQRFRDNNQDVLNHCRVLALAEKIKPDLMAQAKMAETEDWAALRVKIEETHKLVEKLLYDQRDEDLAILVNLGMWMRLFEVAASLVVADEAVKNKSLCVGSVPLLNEMMTRYEKLTEATRLDPSIVLLGNVLQMLQKHWTVDGGTPPQETIQMTFDKLRFIMEKLK